ncbi:DUF4412 domain-containing protein [Peristeroidobacter soli]|jgi:pyrrolidone-carboxylate peptidase|uniref:DUF4412 domain-containing protein n=1 Tax=Peristeroidobacter soli TaxID=2497877 RepID=UPI00101C4E37|nr:DUF4412 domain-containing protein [Peristeroidobacter soli]
MFKRLSILACLALSLSGCISSVDAATLPMPTVEYSADRIIETSQGSFEGKIFAARDKERTETSMQGMQSVMILRKDQQLGWMIMPAQRMYQKLDYKQAQQQSGSQPSDVEITEVGSDTVEGIAATKYKMIMKDGSAGGFLWITPEGITVKMDMLSKDGRDKNRTTVTLKNLVIGPQDAALFDPPADYKAMPSFGGGMKGLFNR